MKKLWKHIVEQQALLLILVVAVAVGGYWYLSRDINGAEELLSVTPAPFLQEVSLSGKVEAQKDVDLGFAAGGRVQYVTVKVGDVVQAGQTLAEVENGDIVALVEQRRAVLRVAEAELAALKVGTRPEQVAVSEADVVAKRVQLEQSVSALVNAIKDAYTEADDAVRTQTDQFFSNPTSNSPQLTFTVASSQTEASVENGRRDMEGMLAAWAGDVAGLSTSGDVDAALLKAKTNLATVASFLFKTNLAITQGGATGAVTQADLNSFAAGVSVARSAINNAITVLTSAETARANATTALVSAQSSLALARAGATQEDITAQEARVASARAAVSDATAQLQKTRITAPFTGTVTTVDAKAGEVASANTPVLSLISASDVLIESYVPEINFAILALGDKARVTLDAYSEETVFAATLTAIDPAETVRDGVSTYRVLLSFDQKDPRIRAGMTANVIIVTDERPGIIAIPQRIVRSKDGVKVVTVKVGDTYVDRQVVTGVVSSSGSVEVVSGLQAGDTVVVVPK
ncbi:MAG: efflux RND transporter periplasmic adaptor subunit [Candidatus Pacebacteria bacterium]|nr:efflux RND transporter periplasmic adaptor subunit [Candidatus Paceibacterota bacterium]